MSNNLDFKSAYFDGIYSPYKSFSTVNHDAVIEELGYDHRFDMNRETELSQNDIQIDVSNIENSFNVISQQDSADFNPSQTLLTEENQTTSQALDNSNQPNFEYNSESKNSVFSLYYHKLEEPDDLFEVSNEQLTAPNIQESGISKLEELKKKAQKVRTIQF